MRPQYQISSNILEKNLMKLAFAFARAEDVGVVVDDLSFVGDHLLHDCHPLHHTYFTHHIVRADFIQKNLPLCQRIEGVMICFILVCT